MRYLSISLSGFTVISALILLLAYLFFLKDMEKTKEGKLACIAMLLGLAGLQAAHLIFFVDSVDLLSNRTYCFLLIVLPIAFLFFSREVLFLNKGIGVWDSLYLLPIAASLVLPVSWLPLLAFLIGSGSTFFIASKIYKLRNHLARFKFEIFFFGLFFIMAVIALVLGLVLPFLNHAAFYYAYANTISVAMVLVVSALIIFPELLSDVLIITESTYANSRLESIDVDAKLRQLDRLMIDEKLYEDENLNLNTVAELVGLSSHQLSELINTHFQYGFSRFIRAHRIRAAKVMLIAEPNASVLAVGLSIGFKSQSSFYTAFKEITGESPGSFRQNNIR